MAGEKVAIISQHTEQQKTAMTWQQTDKKIIQKRVSSILQHTGICRNTCRTLGSEVFWDMGGVCPVVWMKKS